MTLPLPCGSGCLPTAMQDRRQLLQPVGSYICSCRWRGIRHISNNQEQWLGLLWHTAPLGQAAEELLGSLTWAGLHALHAALLPTPPSLLHLDLLSCTSLKVTSWAPLTRAGEQETQYKVAVPGAAGSAFRSYCPAQGRIVLETRVLQGTLHLFNPPVLFLHRSSTALQAAQTYFLGPQAQVSLPAESPWPPPEWRGMGECAPMSHDGGTEKQFFVLVLS